jgi:stalled ribosome rescue protein Dom34
MSAAPANNENARFDHARRDEILNTHYHAVLWIDHHEARITYFNADEAEDVKIHPAHPARHLHCKAGSVDGRRASEDHDFYRRVADAVAEARAVLVTGPANAKTELMKHIERHSPQIAERVVGIETLDHPSEAALVAHARKYFRGADRMRARI